MLAWIAGILIGLLATVVLFLAFPVRLSLSAATEPRARLRVELGLLGGFVPRIVVHDSDRPRRPKVRKPRREKPERRKARRDRKPGKGRVRRILGASPRLARRLIGRVEVERFELEGRFGTGDPADTGQLYGLLAPLLVATGAGNNVHVIPDFERARLDGRADIGLSVTPLTLLPPVLRFGWDVWGPAG